MMRNCARPRWRLLRAMRLGWGKRRSRCGHLMSGLPGERMAVPMIKQCRPKQECPDCVFTVNRAEMAGGSTPLSVGARSETGYVRDENQDRMSRVEAHFGDVYIVSDGMGG